MKLYVNSSVVDLYDKQDLMSLSYSVKELMDPSTVRGERSITIRVPNTVQNFKVLGNPLSYNEDSSQLTSWIEDGGIVWRGIADVLRRTESEYSIALLGNNSKWFPWFKSTPMNELKLGVHKLTESKVTQAWTDEGLLHYPVIDYGLFQDREADFDVLMEYLYPAVRVKPLLRHMFNEAGFDIEFKGSLSTLSWFIPFCTEEVQATPGFLKPHSARASGGDVVNYSNTAGPAYGQTPNVVLPTGTEELDEQLNLGISGVDATYTAPFTGEMRFTAQLDLQFDNNAFDSDFWHIAVWNTTDNVNAGGTATIPVQAGQLWQWGASNKFVMDVPVEATKNYQVVTFMSRFSSGTSQPSNVLMSNVIINYTYRNIIWQENFEYELGTTLPDMKCDQLIKQLNIMYNLVWVTDGSKVTVTPYEELNTGKVGDWSDKVDLTRDQDCDHLICIRHHQNRVGSFP